MGLTERLRQRPSAKRVATLAVAVAMDVLAGYPQGAALGVAVSGAWAVVRAGGAGGATFLARYAAGIGLGLALSAIQWVPFIEYLRESAVLAYRLQWRPLLILPPESLVTFLLPGFYGSPISGDFWGPWGFNEIALGVGLLPWLLLPLALFHTRTRAAVAFFLGMAGLAAAVAFGVPAVGTSLAEVPPLSLAVNLRVVPLIAFALSALGAVGVDLLEGTYSRPTLLERVIQAMFCLLVGGGFAAAAYSYATTLRAGLKGGLPSQYLMFLALLSSAALLVLARLRGRATGAWWAGGCVAVQLVALVPLAWSFNTSVPVDRLYPSVPAIEHLRRMHREDGGRVLLPVPVARAYGLSELGGHDPMIPARIERLIRPDGTLTALGNLTVDVAAPGSAPVVETLIRRVLLAPGAEISGPGGLSSTRARMPASIGTTVPSPVRCSCRTGDAFRTLRRF